VAQLPNIDAFTKWWGPQPSIQIVTFPLNRGREQFIFATTAQDGWRDESWTLPGDVPELRRTSTRTSIPRHARCSTPAPR
jgi:salicylate hydroxylase